MVPVREPTTTTSNVPSSRKPSTTLWQLEGKLGTQQTFTDLPKNPLRPVVPAGDKLRRLHLVAI